MKFRLALLFVFVSLSWYCGQSVNLHETQQLISPELMEEYISFLASDDFLGRNTPGPHLDSAGAYIAREFESFGLSPVNGSWYQQIPLGFVSLGDKNHLILYREGREKNFVIKDDFVPYEITGNKATEGDLIFCGYGIEAPEYGYNDYRNADVNGRVVLLLRHEPGERDTASPFDGIKLSDYSDIEYKVKTAVEKGAVGVIIVNDPLNHSSMKAVGFPWPSLSNIIPADALPLTILKDEFNDIPVVNAGEEFVNYVFGSVQNLKDLQKKIDDEMKGSSMEFPGVRVSIKTTTTVRETPANNIVALLEGSDPSLKNEILVIGAHYDHVGYKKNVPAGEDSIYNGADDNASGTAGVMAIARAFAQLEIKPKRSILFIAFAGEEKGLFGSRYYVNSPLYPLENTVAMLNLDMIGRNEPNSVYINAHEHSPELKKKNEDANSDVGLTLHYKSDYSVSGSDHAPFLKKGIPALFYHSGTHPDYHKVTDEASRIDFIKASRISQLAFLTAFRIAEDNARYTITGSPSIF
jgi:hypothetical protein